MSHLCSVVSCVTICYGFFMKSLRVVLLHLEFVLKTVAPFTEEHCSLALRSRTFPVSPCNRTWLAWAARHCTLELTLASCCASAHVSIAGLTSISGDSPGSISCGTLRANFIKPFSQTCSCFILLRAQIPVSRVFQLHDVHLPLRVSSIASLQVLRVSTPRVPHHASSVLQVFLFTSNP